MRLVPGGGEVKISDFVYFNHYLPTDKQRHYLNVIKQLEITNLDYREFINKYKSEFNPNTILIIDPPYVDTYQGQYTGQFTEGDTIELLKLLKDIHTDFIFFNHDMNKVKQWLAFVDLPYQSIGYTGNIQSTANQKRRDIMAYIKVN